MKLYRLHLRPGGSTNKKFSVDYCLKEGVLGVGWQTTAHKNNPTWEEFESDAIAKHGSRALNQVRYIRNRIRKDDLIWARDTFGGYHLAKVKSEWEYCTNDAAQEADIVNVVRCDIIKVPTIDQVPGKVIACFIPRKSIQAVPDPTSTEYSKQLWNSLSGSKDYATIDVGSKNIFSLLDAEAAEDIIFVYLQTKGWLVIPHSRKGNTMAFEFYAINKDTKARGVVQVKTGHTPLNRDDYKGRSEIVFLFQSNGHYHGDEVEGVHCLAATEMEAFIVANRDIMPANIAFWIDHKHGKT